MSNFLDSTGLTYFWGKIKSLFLQKTDLSNTISNDSTKALTPKAVYDAGYLTSYTETDPTVPAWAKQSTKPTYTAVEVGALPDTTDLSVYMQKGVDYVTAGQQSGTTLGTKSTAEGNDTIVSGSYSHAEGNHTTASGLNTHAEGYYTTASGSASHAEGYYTTASGSYSHAEGQTTTAQRKSQHVFGEYNILDTEGTTTTRGTYVEIVGNGTGAATSARSNARTLDWSGNETLAGKLTLGTDPTESMDAVTKQYMDAAIPKVYSSSNTGGYLTMATLPIYDGSVTG